MHGIKHAVRVWDRLTGWARVIDPNSTSTRVKFRIFGARLGLTASLEITQHQPPGGYSGIMRYVHAVLGRMSRGGAE